MKLLSIFLVLFLLTGAALGASAPMNKDVTTTVKSDTSTANRLGWVAIQTIGNATAGTGPETSDDDQITTATPANNTTHILLRSSGVGSSTFLAQPDYPRNIIVTPSGSATGSLKFTGTDVSGAAITENLTFTTTGVVAGQKAFKTVTRIDGTFSQETARTLKIGTGNVLGLNSKLSRNSVLAEFVNGARETTAGTVTTSSTVLSLNTIDTYTAPGGYVTVVYYVV